MSADSKFRTPGGDTRMLFLGDAALTDGFRLIGFETWADPNIEQLDQLLGELLDEFRALNPQMNQQRQPTIGTEIIVPDGAVQMGKLAARACRSRGRAQARLQLPASPIRCAIRG